MRSEFVNVDPTSGTCAQHAGRRASIVCKQCGDFACGECTVDTLWGDTMCAGCAARGRAVYPLPWLRSLSPASWLQTSRIVLAEARVLFEHFPPGGPLRALGYGSGWIVPMLLVDVAVYASSRNTHWAAASSGPDAGLWLILGAIVLRQLAWLLLSGVGYFLAVRMLGGRAAFGEAIAVTGYNSAFNAATDLALRVPIVSLASIPLTMLSLYFTAWTWSLTARTRFGLTRDRSIVASVLAFVVAALVLVMMSALAVAIIGVADSD